MDEPFKIRTGDCRDLFRLLPDRSVDSIVTDPPYELGFMGKAWDASGIAYDREMWAEALRVLKPGGHLLAFGGSRTYHRMACAIEDAGFEIRDQIMWLYGSGFPKSLNVSKAIDKAAGAERPVVGHTDPHSPRTAMARKMFGTDLQEGAGEGTPITASATKEAAAWDGWGTALKPGHEPIVVARKPLVGTVAANVLEYGAGAINIDATRIGYEQGEVNFDRKQRQQQSEGAVEGAFGAASLIGSEIPTYKPEGRWPANVIFQHTSECRQVGMVEDSMRAGERTANFGTQETQSGGNGSGDWGQRTTAVPVWECAPDCPVLALDEQSGIRAAGRAPKNNNVGFGGVYTEGGERAGVQREAAIEYGAGGASRFFYCAKANKKERNAGLDSQNQHPTVKPIELMRYLCRLVTPSGGLVLDPFTGSGTTGIAATQEGFRFLGFELDDEYAKIADTRIWYWLKDSQLDLGLL